MRVPNLPPRNPRTTYLLSISTKGRDNYTPIGDKLDSLPIETLMCYGRQANAFGLDYCLQRGIRYIQIPKKGYFGRQECLHILAYGLVVARMANSSLGVMLSTGGVDRGLRRLERIARANDISVVWVDTKR